jgi:hypothetical protein
MVKWFQFLSGDSKCTFVDFQWWNPAATCLWPLLPESSERYREVEWVDRITVCDIRHLWWFPKSQHRSEAKNWKRRVEICAFHCFNYFWRKTTELKWLSLYLIERYSKGNNFSIVSFAEFWFFFFFGAKVEKTKTLISSLYPYFLSMPHNLQTQIPRKLVFKYTDTLGLFSESHSSAP